MSRIHEALKRAQQQRSSLAVSTVSDLNTDSPADPLAGTGNGDMIRPALPNMPTNQLKPVDRLDFEQLRAQCQRSVWKTTSHENTFTNPRFGPHAAEQFRTLRSRLYQLRETQPLRKIMVTSALAAEGKTFVSYNLAQAIVRQPDRRVLVIDADLRHSQLHLLWGAPSAPGLSDYLDGKADELKIVHNSQTQNDRAGNLFFIPGGNPPANPSELLMNGRLKMLLDRLSPAFDWIIVDSPPCLPVADANVISQLCDGVVLVILGASTPAATAQRALQELQGRNVLGVVLNAVKTEASYGSSYYGQTAEAEQPKTEAQ